MLQATIAALTLSGQLDNLGETLHALREFAAEIGTLAHLDTEQINGLRLAVDEIATNIISYGYSDASQAQPTIRASAVISLDAVQLTLQDDAPPFNPFEHQPVVTLDENIEERVPGGLGIFLAIRNVDEFNYAREGDVNCNRFVIKRAETSMSARDANRLTDHMANVVLPLGVALSSETDFDRLLERILTEAKSICNADAGTLYLRGKDERLHFAIIMTDSLGVHLGGSSPKPISFPSIPLYNPQTGEPNVHNVATYVALTGNSINVSDMYAADGFDFSAARRFDEQNHYRSVSNLTVPFKGSTGEVVGVMQLLNARNQFNQIIPFDQYSQLIVEILTSQAAVALNTRLLWENQKRLMQIENDMHVARTIQNNFIPSTVPPLRGWDLGGKFQPAREVSGDFYDLFKLADGRIVVMIGDVCDKGIGAALFMSLARSLMRAFTTQESTQSPFFETNSNTLDFRGGMILSAVVNTNAYIVRHHEDLNMFTTLFIGVIEPYSGRVTYINGGHSPPLVIAEDGTVSTRLKPTGPAVGMFDDSEFSLAEIKLKAGDTLFCFTDGVTDARRSDGEFFGEEALVDLLEHPSNSVDGLLDNVYQAVTNFRGDAVQYDDITMVAVRCLGQPPIP